MEERQTYPTIKDHSVEEENLELRGKNGEEVSQEQESVPGTHNQAEVFVESASNHSDLTPNTTVPSLQSPQTLDCELWFQLLDSDQDFSSNLCQVSSVQVSYWLLFKSLIGFLSAFLDGTWGSGI